MRLLQAVALVATFAVAWLVGLGLTGLAAPSGRPDAIRPPSDLYRHLDLRWRRRFCE